MSYTIETTSGPIEYERSYELKEFLSEMANVFDRYKEISAFYDTEFSKSRKRLTAEHKTELALLVEQLVALRTCDIKETTRTESSLMKETALTLIMAIAEKSSEFENTSVIPTDGSDVPKF